jgi:hypothetical protein
MLPPCPFPKVRAAGFPAMPTASPIRMWSSGSNDLWMVGQDGQAGHFDGTSLRPAAGLPLTSGLSSVSGSGPNDVWMSAAAGVVLHFDGKAWTSLKTPTSDLLGDIWAPRSDRVWVLDGSTIYRWDGAAFHAEPTGTAANLNALWGILAADGTAQIWAVGAAGAVVYGQSPGGTPFAPIAGPPNAGELLSIWGSSAKDIWVGSSGVYATGPLYHWDGTSWSTSTLPGGAHASLVYIDSLWGSGPNDVWAAGSDRVQYSSQFLLLMHWDGTAWSQVNLSPASYPQRVTGSSAGDIWAIGSSYWSMGLGWGVPGVPYLYRGNTGGLNVFAGATTGLVVADGTDSLWSLGAPGPLHWNGTAWSSASWPIPSGLLAPVQPSDIWSVSGKTLYHWDGTSWNTVVATLPFQPTLMAANGSGEAWLWNGTTLAHWDGTSVTTESCTMPGTPGSNFWRSMFSGSLGDVWILGNDPSVKGDASIAMHRTSAGCAPASAPPGYIHAIASWAASASDAWVADGGNLVAHYDGSSWTATQIGLTASGTLTGLWGLASDDLWGNIVARNDLGTYLYDQIAHWDGHSWSYGVCGEQIVYVGSSAGIRWAVTSRNRILTE